MGFAVDDGGILVGESWAECSGPNANAVAGRLLLMTTGDASLAAPPPGLTTPAQIRGTLVRGAFDVSVLRLDVLVPSGADCLDPRCHVPDRGVPESLVDGRFNDGFVAELDQSSWMVNGSTIVAPDNFALGPNGVFMSVTGVPADGGHGARSTTAGASASRCRRRRRRGCTRCILSIFEATDGSRDSAAFVDGLRSGTTIEGECVAGGGNPAPPPPRSSASASASAGAAASSACGARPAGRPRR